MKLGIRDPHYIRDLVHLVKRKRELAIQALAQTDGSNTGGACHVFLRHSQRIGQPAQAVKGSRDVFFACKHLSQSS